jgi:phosphoribosyl-ATP pyrophosphohydrolase/phosphoribosyl-AMP cyclohydrolase/histidinol dehydrogenase
MTAVTARSAGVEEVWVASPRPTSTTLAAAAVAGADGLLAVGGAQAVAALAWGAGEVPACDIVVGPGNRWVTAAKKLVAGEVAVDMLAGPSELVVIADASADSATVAADLLAQAEHDPDALPMLIALEAGVVEKVNREIAAALEDLPTAGVARKALSNGFAIVAADREEAGRVCDAIAPEHLQLSVEDPDEWLPFLGHFGAIFLGNRACEVFGDYGAGPNHVLPTGGSARRTGGLSVFHFLRVRTWLRDDAPSINDEFLADAVALARMEGLEAHARAALLRGSRIPDRSSRR